MKNLAIFYGGKSVEHDISIITAIQVMKNIDKSKYKIVPIYIDQNNNWLILKDYLNMNIYANKSYKSKKIVTGFYNKCVVAKNKFLFKKQHKIDVAINCMHGLNGEDGTLSGLLELANIPYVGSGVVGSALGMDKVLQKDVFVSNNIPCAKYTYFEKEEYIENKEKIVTKIEEQISYPMVVKPANLGSSIGINISKNKKELIKNIEISLNFDKKIIIEEQILNLREINCSVIGNFKTSETSVLEEPCNWKYFLDFNEKYMSDNSYNKKQIDITLGEELDNKIKNLSKQIFKIFGCSGVVRIDFLLNNKTKELYVNEINTIPGSFAYYLWDKNFTLKELLNKLIDFAYEEWEYKNMYNYTFKTDVLKRYVGGNKILKK